LIKHDTLHMRTELNFLESCVGRVLPLARINKPYHREELSNPTHNMHQYQTAASRCLAIPATSRVHKPTIVLTGDG
jgi:hypothetical protein